MSRNAVQQRSGTTVADTEHMTENIRVRLLRHLFIWRRKEQLRNENTPRKAVPSSKVALADDDLDESVLHVTRYRPEELEKLIKATKFNRKEIQLIYRGFKQECPTGTVDEDSFKEIFAQFFPQGDATQYAHFVFNTFKNRHDGVVSFQDFLTSLSQVSRGTVHEKLRWVFALYDLNGDGLISKAEMTTVASAIYEMLGRCTDPAVDDHTAKQHVDDIFHKIDANHDGVITLDELVQWCTREDRYLQSLDMLDTIL